MVKRVNKYTHEILNRRIAVVFVCIVLYLLFISVHLFSLFLETDACTCISMLPANNKRIPRRK